MPKYRRWTCKECRQQFTAKTGTIFEDSPISFSKWLPAIWLLTATRNGTSSMELHRALGVTQKTAWFMLHRIREALADRKPDLLEGPVEADETFVGGKIDRMNAKRKRGLKEPWSGTRHSRHAGHQVAVMAMVERNVQGRPKGRARAYVVPFIEREYLQGNIRKHVAPGSEVHTDGFPRIAA